MALTVDTNSYLAVVDADAYFLDRLNTSAWDGASAGDKSASLIQATKAIEAMSFTGSRSESTQKLSFPRSGVYVDNILIDSTKVPQDVKDAVCEYAILMLQEDYTTPDDLEAFESITLGAIKVDTKSSSGSNGKPIPPMVSALLDKYKDTSVRLVRA